MQLWDRCCACGTPPSPMALAMLAAPAVAAFGPSSALQQIMAAQQQMLTSHNTAVETFFHLLHGGQPSTISLAPALRKQYEQDPSLFRREEEGDSQEPPLHGESVAGPSTQQRTLHHPPLVGVVVANHVDFGVGEVEHRRRSACRNDDYSEGCTDEGAGCSEWRSGGRHCRGVCRHWNDERGYGFISVEEELSTTGAGLAARRPAQRRDLFVHYSDIAKDGYRSLDVGELLEFEVARNDQTGKTKATQVSPVIDDFDDVFDDVFDDHFPL